MHHSFLFILVSLITQIIEGQDRVVPRENGPHQVGPVQVVATRPFLDKVHKSQAPVKHGVPIMAVTIEFHTGPSHPRVSL